MARTSTGYRRRAVRAAAGPITCRRCRRLVPESFAHPGDLTQATTTSEPMAEQPLTLDLGDLA
ncbi:hypothetical protein ACIGO9_29990 [Nocardia asteroides]|uniref:hypothetical protein n=1 Tax=Nocardia asteroides TaxID=1824 RepID=UPI0037C6247C